MFKVANKDTRKTPMALLFRRYFTPCSSVSIVNFELVIAAWAITETLQQK